MGERVINNKWVFVSHSTKDFEAVRKVRNLLEEWRFRPLLFFLKCLDQDTEISDLIKREIECRTRFLLCESDNTNYNNGWVQREVAYIKSLNRRCDVINLNSSDSSIYESLELFRRNSIIYLSHSKSTNLLAHKLAERLVKYDFDVVSEVNENKEDFITKAINNGVFIPIISEDYEASRFDEILYARKVQIEKIRSLVRSIRRAPNILSIFTYDAFTANSINENTIDEIWDEPCEEVYDLPVDKQCDNALRFILRYLFSWGTIYAFARNFETDAEQLDYQESSFLYQLMLDEEIRYLNNERSRVDEFDGFPGAIARCYEYGCCLKQRDLRKALIYYEDELHTQLEGCKEKQRTLILNNLANNIIRVHQKLWQLEYPDSTIVPPFVSIRYPNDFLRLSD